MSKQETSEEFGKFGYGVFLLKSKNSLFNADFAHEPRQLPDDAGTFYATDKSLKYCIRSYVYNTKGDTEVFFWRRNNEALKALDLGENYSHLFGEAPKKKGNLEAALNLLKCWDVRVFGATFAEADCNLSITGPVQITYGINKAPLAQQKYSNQILSPFRDSKESKEEAKARTLGSESKALEMHLMFDYVINPNTLRNQPTKLKQTDVAWFKEALCKGVSYVNSSAKIGSESEFMLYIESSSHNTLPLLKDIILVAIKDGKTEIDLVNVRDLIARYGITYVEIYYEPSYTVVKNIPDGTKKFNIYTLEETK